MCHPTRAWFADSLYSGFTLVVNFVVLSRTPSNFCFLINPSHCWWQENQVRNVNEVVRRKVMRRIYHHYSISSWCTPHKIMFFLWPTKTMSNSIKLKWINNSNCPWICYHNTLGRMYEINKGERGGRGYRWSHSAFTPGNKTLAIVVALVLFIRTICPTVLCNNICILGHIASKIEGHIAYRFII